MQFHLNGFRSGDPEVSGPPDSHGVLRPTDTLPEEVDVLIIGAGPTGLTLAAQLSRFPSIKTCIIEQKAGPRSSARLMESRAEPWKCSRPSVSASAC